MSGKVLVCLQFCSINPLPNCRLIGRNVQQSYNNSLALAIKVIYKTAKIINYFAYGDSAMMRSLLERPGTLHRAFRLMVFSKEEDP